MQPREWDLVGHPARREAMMHAHTAQPQEVAKNGVDTINVTGTADWRDSEISRLRRRVVELEREVERLRLAVPPPRTPLAAGSRVPKPEPMPDKRPPMYVPPAERAAAEEEQAQDAAVPEPPQRRRLFWHGG